LLYVAKNAVETFVKVNTVLDDFIISFKSWWVWKVLVNIFGLILATYSFWNGTNGKQFQSK
jgi:hypothetical protein